MRFYREEGTNSGVGVGVADGAGKTGAGEFVELEVIFAFAWSIFEVSDWFCGSRFKAFLPITQSLRTVTERPVSISDMLVNDRVRGIEQISRM